MLFDRPDMNLSADAPLSLAESIFCAADTAEEHGDFTLAASLFLQAALMGDGAAMSRLANLYESGQGVSWDVEASMAWDRRAIDAGYAASRFNLGITCRRSGQIQQARYWFKQALEHGDGEAALELAKLYAVSDKERDTVRGYLQQVLHSEDVFPSSKEEATEMLAALDQAPAKAGPYQTGAQP